MVITPEEGERSSNEELSGMASQAAPGFLREMWDFIWHNKKWWLAPIIVALLLLAGLRSLAYKARQGEPGDPKARP